MCWRRVFGGAEGRGRYLLGTGVEEQGEGCATQRKGDNADSSEEENNGAGSLLGLSYILEIRHFHDYD